MKKLKMFEMHLKFASRKFCTKPPMVLETANTTSISTKAPFDDVFLLQISAPSIRERVPQTWTCFHQKTSSGVASSGGRIWQFLAPVIRRVDR